MSAISGSSKSIVSKVGNFMMLPFRRVSFFKSLAELWQNKNIRKRVLFTLGAILLYRFLANIPPLGMDIDKFIQTFQGGVFTNIYTMMTGGRLDRPSLVMVGLGAYINASIIIQLLSTVIPKLEALSEEGHRGRTVLNQYTRFLTIPLSILQSYVFYLILKSSSVGSFVAQDSLEMIAFVACTSAGSLVLMWISELITESGIGNGSSVIISLSIISSLPNLIHNDIGGIYPQWEQLISGNLTIIQFLSSPDVQFLFALIAGLILVTVLIVLVNEGVRKIAVQYARRVAGTNTNFLPIRVNHAGVMPIIFASALMTFPNIIAQVIINVGVADSQIVQVAHAINNSFISNYRSIGYNAIYFVLIFLFTFFYTFVVVKPSKTSENLQKAGGFIPGIRPGKNTEKYISEVMIRLGIVGSFFLGFLAIIPSIAKLNYGASDPNRLGIISGIGGTSILIVVSVVLLTYRQIQSLRVTKTYDRYR